MSITILQGDITTQLMDALVNAANPHLRGGGGVDGAIHRAAGPQLLEACQALRADPETGVRCRPGRAVITPGFNLTAKFVIHAVGPVFDPNNESESRRFLRHAHNACFHRALDHHCRSIAFPALSCGVYGFPPDKAAPIAVNTARYWLRTNPERIDEVRFVLFTDECFEAFSKANRDPPGEM